MPFSWNSLSKKLKMDWPCRRLSPILVEGRSPLVAVWPTFWSYLRLFLLGSQVVCHLGSILDNQVVSHLGGHLVNLLANLLTSRQDSQVVSQVVNWLIILWTFW
jgi:hypothetical protein